METVDVIIPAYRPGKEFEKLLDSLSTQNYPVEKILVMNTEEKFWNTAWEKKFPKVNVVHLKKADFDHGGIDTRLGQCHSGAALGPVRHLLHNAEHAHGHGLGIQAPARLALDRQVL